MEKLLDILGEMAIVGSVIAPFIVMPTVWKFLDGNRSTRVMTGLILSAVVSFLLFCIGMALVLRDGLGPT